jgi:hypothetical protein
MLLDYPDLAPEVMRRASAAIEDQKALIVKSSKNIEEKWEHIYRLNLSKRDRTDDSISGPGSTLAYTENLRSKLPALFSKYSFRKVVDAPCGDFNWMQHVLQATQISYVGGDIVRSLIEDLNTKYRNDKARFIHLDLTKDQIPNADLLICRDLLFHLSYSDTKAVIENFISSNIPFLLTTTHRNEGQFINQDILTGSFRRIDLFASPYNFPKDPLARIEDWVQPHFQREMCLWTKEQVAEAFKLFEK